MLRVLLADDHALVRQGLKTILTEEFKTVSYGEATDGTEALELVLKQDWDLLILDITMPGKGGFDILTDLKAEKPDLPILVLSMHSEDQFALRVLNAGAAGYITKEKAPREVISAVIKVLSGGRYLSPSFTERFVLDLAVGGMHPVGDDLSHREFQVLRMIAAGKTLTAIAGALSLSIKTVSTYKDRVLKKLRLKTNDDLIKYAIRNNIF